MNLTIGETYKVIVLKYLAKGIIVKMVDDESHTEFIHLSKISNQFVSDVSQFVKVGEELEAIYVEDPKVGAQLSLKHLNLEPKYTSARDEALFAQKKAEQEVFITTSRTNDQFVFSEYESLNKSHNLTLDEMIAKSNAVFADKMQGRKLKDKRGGRR